MRLYMVSLINVKGTEQYIVSSLLLVKETIMID
jgi:hypothetical protein